MIDFPIVDTHLHLWDPQKLRYPWLDNVPLLNKPYLLSAYNKACGNVKVEKMVFLQCECDFAAYRQEAEWVTGLARQNPRIQGIVPWAPLEKGERARAEVAALARNPLIKGIRRIIQFESDVEYCLKPDFVKGVQLLADFNLHFEICIKGDPQFRNTIQLVRQCPRVKFILDHIGKPFIKERILEPWRSLLKELAGLPNAWCKMSGLVTEADFQKWTKADLKPYVDAVMECFGWERVMFGGDWPVAFQATTYPRWVETLEWALAGASDQQLRNIFRNNAIAFYRLPQGARGL
ncbi:MAG: amidohydrolase family protein [Verrucomicrobia bacterium]|nr:amidohydrolase family protein [Verrucomicrobiota bacterium]